MFASQVGKIISGTVLAGVLVGGAGAAFAGTQDTSFSTTIGVFGSAAYTNAQTKAVSNQAGNIAPSYIQYDRTISAREYRTTDGSRGTERTGIAAGDSVSLPNSFNKGNNIRAELAGNFTWTTRTQVDGTWRSN